MADQTIDTDLAIVGAGGCGLTAAIAAANEDAKVLLLECDTQPGGTTAMSAGLIVAAKSALQEEHGEKGSAEELAADILRLNGQESDPALTHALCLASGPLIDWLAEQGVDLEHLRDYRYQGMSRSWLLAPPQRHGEVITQALARKTEQLRGIDLRLHTTVTELTHSRGSVWELKAINPDIGTLFIKAKAVILASSGFGANPTMVAKHIPELAGAAYFGSPYAMGEAISWGKANGAAIDHMSTYQPHSSIAYPEMILVTTYLINHGAIQVNQSGERFGDETDSYSGHAIALQGQPGQTAIEIFDEQILFETMTNYPRFKECLDAGIVHSANSLPGLAKIFELNESNLITTVNQYNSQEMNSLDKFGRVGTGHKLGPPFYGVQVTSALVQTLGGLRVNHQAQVLRSDNKPIPGLYAGGGAAAGLAGHQPEGYMAGTGLLTAFGLGWIAGREASMMPTGI